jgi:signal transduction histidine kinase
MMPRRHIRWVYAALAGFWLAVLVWQVVEHARVQQAARVELRNRAKDISSTVGIMLRSQRRFGLISRERIELALSALVRPNELNAVALLNAAGDVVAAAPTNEVSALPGGNRSPEHWEPDAVTIVNLVDLGTNVLADAEETEPSIVVSRDSFSRPSGTNRPPEIRPPPPEGERGRGPGDRSGDGRERGDGDRRFRFGRPPWMSEADFKTMIEKQGVHSFLLVLSTRPVHEAARRDLWLRIVIVGLTTLTVGAVGLAWGKTAGSAELQIRLVRASEMNSYLREMNLAAAGLAHETRNPLNIIRGLAQMIAKRPDTANDIRERSLEIVNEADRVAGQLNDFINYSRPREVRPTPVVLTALLEEVRRALSFDLEEKRVQFRMSGPALTVTADEQLLRQALFNLALNAIQAVGPEGQIEVHTYLAANGGAGIEVRDDGPGVPPEERTDIFKPYFTKTQRGTGLGLAVVQQIVLAHGWEIECLANSPRGACFRISHVQTGR